jgi:hypothetical protein
VFTEYRDTLAQIGAFLTPAHDPLLLHGGLSTAQRAAVQRAFNASGGLLLATDAASEGLNLHEQCRLVIHFELPWTPTRLQQRTGRVDRIGQSRPVHEVLLVARDTSERLVLAPLLRRSRLAAAQTGRPSVVIEESRVAAAVMQGAPLEVEEPVPFLPPASLDLTDDARFETERIQLHRRLLQLRKPRQEERPWDTVMTIRRHASRVLAIVRVTLRDASERAVHEELIPMRLTDARLPSGGSARQLPEWTHPMVESARQHALVRMDEVITRVREQIRAMAERERELASGLTSKARVLIQPGLFDQRAIRDADARSHVQASILEEIALRLRSLDPDASFDVEASLVGIRSER